MKSDQTAGDSAIVVSATGNVSIVSGITVTEAKDLFRLMLQDSLAGLQAEAMATAEARNEELLDDFMNAAEARFGEKIEEKLSGFRDPGAQYAFRAAQTEYCKYGDDSGKTDSLELLMDRLECSSDTMEKIVIDEALKVCGRLSAQQIDLIVFLLVSYHVVMSTTVFNSQINDLFVKLGEKLSGLECSHSSLSLAVHLGVITLHPGGANWKPFGEVVRERYGLFFTKPAPFEAYDLDGADTNGVLHRTDDGLYVPVPILEAIWRLMLISKYDAERAEKAIAFARQNRLTSDEIYNLAASVAPAFEGKKAILQNVTDGVLSYRLTAVGIALGMARARREGWKIPATLAQLIG